MGAVDTLRGFFDTALVVDRVARVVVVDALLAVGFFVFVVVFEPVFVRVFVVLFAIVNACYCTISTKVSKSNALSLA